MDNILNKHREIWKSKKMLRDIYTEWYIKIINNLSDVPGKTLELGSGTGNLKEYKTDIITSDIDPHPWLDMIFDAHKIPLKNNQLSNIVMVDVLHHLENPVNFFFEAYRVLKKGGRIIMVEPYPSPFASLIYKLFHPEPFIFNIDYFNKTKNKNTKKPWEANQAIPYLLFFKQLNKFNKTFSKNFEIVSREKFSFILYPLSGGFENRQIISNKLIPVAQRLEKLLIPLKDILAFRCFIVLEKIN